MLNNPRALASPSPMPVRWLRTKTGFAFSLVLMGGALLLSLLFSASVGVAGGNISILIDTLFHPAASSDIGRIMLEMRMPRALAACFTGAAFALAGGVMQGVTWNPLADAGLLGVNARAGFFVALTAVILPPLSSLVTMLFAF
ncbi:MAG: iron chelate uptake ABC transporter family permease subunit, partial [Lacrimispora sphenoides]